MKQDEVVEVYKLLFAAPPLQNTTRERKAKRFATKQGLANRLIHREEFLSNTNQKRLDTLPATSELVLSAFALMLDRKPSDEELLFYTKGSHGKLLRKLARSREYAVKSSSFSLMRARSFNSVARTIFLHIPKTAGKSFEELAIKNYGRECVSLSTSGRFSAAEWNRSALIGGHFSYSKYDGMKGRRLFLSVVRDPVERALSRFNYYRNAKHQQAFRSERGFDNANPKHTMLRSAFSREFVDNVQCRHLSGAPRFEKVFEVLSCDRFILGSFEDLQSWVSLVATRLGWDDTELPTINMASRPDYMREFFADDDLIQELRERNKDDYALYDFVKAHGVYESSPSEYDYAEFTIANQRAALDGVEPLGRVKRRKNLLSEVIMRFKLSELIILLRRFF